MENKKMAAMFKAFGDENRIQILQLLKDGEKCACHLLEGMKITQPTLSHHMKLLCDAGIVTGRKEGKWMHYSISEKGLREMEEYLAQLIPEKKSEKSCCKK
ncbi:MAG: metalloregulator ArsR/SmtB family transcription factor [Clostridiales bacterium]|nr:metalloregulator ArsR/SmtB family transcription factor [Clostridiales bacterium]